MSLHKDTTGRMTTLTGYLTLYPWHGWNSARRDCVWPRRGGIKSEHEEWSLYILSESTTGTYRFSNHCLGCSIDGGYISGSAPRQHFSARSLRDPDSGYIQSLYHFSKTLPQGPPPASPFDIPIPNLRREFLALQALVHPDKYPSGATKQRAEALSAHINDAYRTLSDPLTRAQYLLLFQHGIDVTSEDGAKTHPQDPETLMQVLETQEMIEEAENEATISGLKSENEGRVNETVRALGAAVDRGDVDEAVRECVRLRFWYSIRDVLREWEPGMRDVRLVH
ncbi:hypothetical protein CIHG_08010 [Coccidioides immitis H538.4]|uniref:Co-chaperone HscB C-terminal oligomerisation domain-containing protein n=1 Tax=Coccidioides immitis H538.4 TaxID=396776 RepID=A0A0J8RYJ1_COCIT|nr:hypothetical protein CIHG_08010 [Coccidioides immitis H538.4]